MSVDVSRSGSPERETSTNLLLIIAQSRQVYLMADHTKFGRPSLVRLGHVSQVRALFTDQPIPADMAAVFADARTEIHVAL